MSELPSQSTPNAKGVNSSQQQNQLPTPPDSSRTQRAGGYATGNATSGSDQPAQPVGRPRRYTTYPDLVSPQQQQPAPYQSNGRRRRRTQAELLMHHALAWLGYGEVVPNVSVVTGGPLVDGEIPTHGTWELGVDGYDDVDDLATRVSRSLTIATNRTAAEEQRALKRGGA